MPDKTGVSGLPSPCQQICELDREDICIGCARSRSEIGEWSRASSVRQAQIWQNVRARRAAANRSESVGSASPVNPNTA